MVIRHKLYLVAELASFQLKVHSPTLSKTAYSTLDIGWEETGSTNSGKNKNIKLQCLKRLHLDFVWPMSIKRPGPDKLLIAFSISSQALLSQSCNLHTKMQISCQSLVVQAIYSPSAQRFQGGFKIHH